MQILTEEEIQKLWNISIWSTPGGRRHLHFYEAIENAIVLKIKNQCEVSQTEIKASYSVGDKFVAELKTPLYAINFERE